MNPQSTPASGTCWSDLPAIKDSPKSRANSWNATSPLTGSTVPSKPSAANTTARLHQFHTRNAEHLNARNATGKRDLDRDVNRLDATDAGRVNGKRLERHHDTCQSNALY